MADAAVVAPLKKVPEWVTLEDWDEKVVKGSNEYLALTRVFDIGKKYMFEAADTSIEREHPIIDMVTKRPIQHQKFRPYQNIVLTSQIVWNGQRRMLRYYDGCTSIFQDKQPKEKELIDQLIENTQRDKYKLLEGKFGVYGDERMLLMYMNICSWNAESPFKTRTSDTIFIAVNADKAATAEANRLDETEKALDLAKNAPEDKMRMHSAYLGIATDDYDSGNERSENEIRTEYRKYALQNANGFIESYGNKAIEAQYYINKAWEQGTLTNKFNPNKVTWKANNNVICDISGLRSPEAITQAIFEFSQSEAGEEFLIQLKAVSE